MMLNGGLVEPFFDAMSQKYYCATLKYGSVEPFPCELFVDNISQKYLSS
jgi:hypothetical protein